MFSILILTLLLLLAFLFYFPNYKRNPHPLSFTKLPVLSDTRKGAKGPIDLALVFPPSRRYLLAQVLPDSATPIDHAESNEHLRIDEHWCRAVDSTRVFSGFTVGEIKSLGDFPDYATISGVPLPSPLKAFDISKAKSRPYRPFRLPYHQTMSYRKMESDFWLELESTYPDRIRQRQQLYRDHGTEVLTHLSGSELACKEVMEMALQFLCARYPTQFQLVIDGTDKVLVNDILGTRHNLAHEEPLHVLLNNVPEDFGIMLRGEDGKYVFRAGIICTAQGWSLGDKIGKPLSAIHEPVPDYKTKMERSMDKFFSRLATDSPIQRAAWGLEVDQPMHAPAGHPDYTRRQVQDPELTEDNINIRVDWQTLRRLPLSGAIVINVKVLFVPLIEIRDEPYVPELLMEILNEGKQEILKYKGTWHVEHVVKPALRRWAAEQRNRGMVEEGWEVGTLDDYPFFPGWERKYRKF